MSDAFGFGKLVPGFEFLQNLTQSASASTGAAAAMPGVSNWVAPTLSIEDIDKRIQELKSVLFWLEQNSTALKATIQALEVQKMTLSTLQGMNVNMAELARAFSARPSEAAPAVGPAAAPSPAPAEPAAAPTQTPQAAAEPSPRKTKTKAAPEPANPSQEAPAVDPMQWWGSLTQQFQNIAATALKDVAAQAMNAPQAAAAAGPTASKPVARPVRQAARPAAKKASPAARKKPRA